MCRAFFPRKIAWGTKDITEGPAMTRAQAIQAIETGIEIADKKAKEGYKVFTIGEMGISIRRRLRAFRGL